MLNEIKDYLPIFNAILITDLFVILLMNMKIIDSKVLKEWYSKYNLSAVIADVLIIFIVLILTSYIYNYFFSSLSIIKFICLALIIQIIHDILFYILITNIPRGMNKMIDTFKDYANETSYRAIIGDSCMIIMSCLIAHYLIKKSTETNINILIVFLYLTPYLIYN